MSINEILVKHLGPVGLMISMSKTAPKGHVCLFNGNVVVDGKKVWYGDLDLTKQAKKLKLAAKEIGLPLYILREMDARFEFELNPQIKNAIEVIQP